MTTMTTRKCRHCQEPLDQLMIDLGSSPLCNTLLDSVSQNEAEAFYPLAVRVCGSCFLAQLDDFVMPSEIFTEYSYFSSFSTSFVEHAARYVEDSIRRFELGKDSLVMEVASNDGYLLQHFLPHGIPVLGIEPALNVAEAAKKKGIRTISEFLGEETALEIVKKEGTADLVAANNVMAHTPFLNDFVSGLAILAGENGSVTVEFPHILRMLELNQFDTIYHEHFSYYSFFTVEKIFESVNLKVFDVVEIDTHGGSIRVYASQNTTMAISPRVEAMREFERVRHVDSLDTYANFTPQVVRFKREFLSTLIEIRESGKSIVAYGVPGKGNTLLNYCGIRTDFIDYMVDKNPYKQNKLAPGSRIPIFGPERIQETKPDYVLVMVWNMLDEVTTQLEEIRTWGGQFIVAVPKIRIL